MQRQPGTEMITDTSRFERMISHAPVAISIVRPPEFIVEAANRKQLDLWNRTADEVINRPLFDIFPEAKSQDFDLRLREVYTTGRPYHGYEVPTQLMRGGQLDKAWFNFIYEPVRDDEGSIDAIMVVSTEVTEQVRSRIAKQESEEKYRLLFNLMDQGFCVMDMIFDDAGKCVDYRFLECNEVFSQQTGLVNATGKTALELVPNLEERWFQIYGDVAITGKSNRFIEGSEVMGRWFEVYAFRVGDQGSRKVALLFTDITERKKAEMVLRESEERFRTIADQSPMIIYIVEPDELASMSYFNQAWLTYTGQSFEESIGTAWQQVVHPDDVAGIFEIYSLAFNNQEAYLLPAVRLKRFDGEYRWHLFRGTPRRLPDGKFIGYIGVGFDIHEQKIAEEKLRLNEEILEQLVADRTRELKRSNEDLQHFAHVASHDLKEPVRKIRTFESRIRGELDQASPKVLQYLSKIDSAANRMSAMIDGVLLYSSVDGIQQEQVIVDLNKVFNLIESDLEVMIEQKQAVIQRASMPSIRGNQVLLYQLFYNLVINSLKFSREGIVPVISIREVETESINEQNNDPGFVTIEVSDNGIGFPAQYAQRIFDTFLRLHPKDRYEGTGLGLSLCKKIAERHGGSIAAFGEEGVGAIFRVRLPGVK